MADSAMHQRRPSKAAVEAAIAHSKAMLRSSKGRKRTNRTSRSAPEKPAIKETKYIPTFSIEANEEEAETKQTGSETDQTDRSSANKETMIKEAARSYRASAKPCKAGAADRRNLEPCQGKPVDPRTNHLMEAAIAKNQNKEQRTGEADRQTTVDPRKATQWKRPSLARKAVSRAAGRKRTCRTSRPA